jgi:hypothetical protein
MIKLSFLDGARPTLFIFLLFYVFLFVLYYVLFLCDCVLPPANNPIAVNKMMMIIIIIVIIHNGDITPQKTHTGFQLQCVPLNSTLKYTYYSL